LDVFRLEDIKSCLLKAVKVTAGVMFGQLFKD